MQWKPATLQHTRWMDHRPVHHGSPMAIPIPDPLHVENAYGYSASGHHWIEWHVRSYGWCYASFGEQEDQMEGWLILRREVCAPDAVQISFWSNSNDRSGSHFSPYPWCFSEAAIVEEVGQGNRYQSWWRDFVHHTLSGGLSVVCGEWILYQTAGTVSY